MIINDPNGRAARVKPGGLLYTLSISESLFHATVREGIGWSLGGVITAADAADHVVFYLENTSDEDMEIHGIFVSSAIVGLCVIETGRSYSSGGGTALALRQLRTDSGSTQTQTSYVANNIVLTGTATEIVWKRVAADSDNDLLCDEGVIILAPTTKMAIRFDADSGTPVIAVTVFLHGEEPWEEE